MDRTMQSITQSLHEQDQAFSRFRRADQLALDELFVAAQFGDLGEEPVAIGMPIKRSPAVSGLVEMRRGC